MDRSSMGPLARAVGAVVDNLNPAWFPTAGRTFVSSMQGVRSPITERSFTPEELTAMQRLVALRGGESGSIHYSDYDTAYPENPGNALSALRSPEGNVRTTLGQFTYRYDPQRGGYEIRDAYDFNRVKGGAEQTAEAMSLSPYALARYYGGEMLPEGTGREVRIALPPSEKPKHVETVKEKLKRMVEQEITSRAKSRK